MTCEIRVVVAFLFAHFNFMHGPFMFQLTAKNFEAFVYENADRLSLIHFRADWNPLDSPMREVIADVEAAVGDQMGLAEVDCSLEENLELQEHLGLSHIPAMFFVFRNRVVDYKVGYSKVRLVGHVQQLMQIFSPYHQQMPKPLHPGPFPSAIVLPPEAENDSETNSFGGPARSGNFGGGGASLPGQNLPMPLPTAAQNYGPPIAPHRPNSNFGQSDFGPPKFGLIPYRLVSEQPKKSWWSRLLS